MSADMAGTFRGRRVLVTGHTGFKGSWLALWLHRLGARVYGYALPPPTQPSHFELAQIQELLAGHVEADVRDGARLEQALRATQPEVIFHLAAQALVRAGYVRPRETFETNVIGTVSLLDAVRAAGRPCAVVVVTSDKCYASGAPDAIPAAGFREGDPLGGHEPYSASKGAAELVVAAYRDSYFPPRLLAEHGVALASARAGNVIGGGDWAHDRVVTDIVASLSTGKPVPVRNPSAVRPWQHVLEPLWGYLLLAARLVEATRAPQSASDAACWCSAWNFGPLAGDDVRVEELVDRFIATWGRGSWEDVGTPGQPAETAILRLCPDKAIAQLGWRPRWDVAEAVRRTAAWYRTYYREPAAAPRAASLADIAAYETAEPTARGA